MYGFTVYDRCRRFESIKSSKSGSLVITFVLAYVILAFPVFCIRVINIIDPVADLLDILL